MRYYVLTFVFLLFSSTSFSFQVFVRFVSNKGYKTITINCEKEDTIEYIKEKILNKSEIPIRYYNLTYSGKLLKDEQLVEDYDIEKESTVNLIITPRQNY